MTLKQALEKFDRVCKNNIPKEIKTEWLSLLDASVFEEIILTHEDPIQTEFTPYDDTTPEDTVLLIKEPYSEIYLCYLSMKKDLYYSDIARYNNDLALYTAAYMNFENHYNSKHQHIRTVDYFNA